MRNILNHPEQTTLGSGDSSQNHGPLGGISSRSNGDHVEEQSLFKLDGSGGTLGPVST